MLSLSSELTPSSNINNNDHTSDSHTYSEDQGHSAIMSHSASIGTITNGGTQVRKLSSLNSGFKASAPFLSSYAPQGVANNAAVSFKPSPIQIPSNSYLSSTSTVASPMHTVENATQAHAGLGNYPTQLTSEATNNMASQVQSLDLSFVSLFTESKQEILKLLRDDKFPRFKITQEFHQFINAIKPYQQDVVSGENGNSYHNFDNSLIAFG